MKKLSPLFLTKRWQEEGEPGIPLSTGVVALSLCQVTFDSVAQEGAREVLWPQTTGGLSQEERSLVPDWPLTSPPSRLSPHYSITDTRVWCTQADDLARVLVVADVRIASSWTTS